MKTISNYFSARVFTSLLALTACLIIILSIYHYRLGQDILSIKDRYNHFEKAQQAILYLDDAFMMSKQMYVLTGQSEWKIRYQEQQMVLSKFLQEAILLYPQVYRKEIKPPYGKVLKALNYYIKQQVDADLMVAKSQSEMVRLGWISTMIILLMSWMVIIRMTRRFQESLVETNKHLEQRTQELNELTHTLEEKVEQRTCHLEKALKDLRKAQSQLLQSEKFAAVGQLAAGVAHEINNPIGFINSNLETMEQYVVHYTQLLGILNKLERALKNKDRQRVDQVVLSWEKIRKETNFEFIDDDIGNLLKESKVGTERIRKIISDLRNLASPDHGIMTAISLEGLMDSMLNIVWNQVKYKAEVRKFYTNLPLVSCNPQKIGQVFVHLLINAAQSMDHKGIITIKTYKKDELVCMDISDTGRGIAPEHLTKIFDPFFTTRPVGVGVGLGLSISYDIIRKHGGQLSFASKLGEGTTFTVMMPAQQLQDVPSDLRRMV